VSTSPRTTAALLVIGALLGGIVLGAAGDRALLVWQHRLLPSHRRLETASQRIVNHLDRELHFTTGQRAEVQQIIDRHRQRIEAIWASVRPQTRQEIDATNAEIDRVRTPDQQAKFKTMRANMQQHGPRGMRPHRP